MHYRVSDWIPVWKQFTYTITQQRRSVLFAMCQFCQLRRTRCSAGYDNKRAARVHVLDIERETRFLSESTDLNYPVRRCRQTGEIRDRRHRGPAGRRPSTRALPDSCEPGTAEDQSRNTLLPCHQLASGVALERHATDAAVVRYDCTVGWNSGCGRRTRSKRSREPSSRWAAEWQCSSKWLNLLRQAAKRSLSGPTRYREEMQINVLLCAANITAALAHASD